MKYREEIHLECGQVKFEGHLEELQGELFLKILRSLETKPGKEYSFITKARALLNQFWFVLKDESIPDAWHETAVIEVQKRKTRPDDLKNVRNLHEKSNVCKFFGQIVD